MQNLHKIQKIYSRPRLNLPHRQNTPNFYKNRKKLKKIFPIFGVWSVAIFVCFSVWSFINPIFSTLCENKAEEIATKITNDETSKIMTKYSYESFFTVEKDSNGKIQMITANVLKINQVTSDIAYNIQKTIGESENSKIFIPSGALTGFRIFSGFGPKIAIHIVSSGNVETNVRSEFVAQGVNQTVHRVYLEIKTNVDILTAFNTIQKTIENQVLILENVIIGEIPSTYYNFQGTSNEEEAIRLVE